jgi:hypothetical protein
MATTSSLFGRPNNADPRHTVTRAIRIVVVTAVSAALTAATLAYAAPPRPVRKPSTRTAVPTTRPATPKSTVAPQAPAKSEAPAPTPPQPRREEQTNPAPKSSLSQPAPAPAAPDVDPNTTVDAPKPAPVRPRTTDLFGAPPLEVKSDTNGKYLLRYNFSKGETIRWEVIHRAKFITTVQGNTQTAETTTKSVKAWKITETQPGGEATLLHEVESIDMRQKLTGRQETRYDSRTDKEVPPIFAEAAKQVGIPLTEVTIDNRGNVLKRVDRIKRPDGALTSTITIVLPEKPLAVGESWTVPFNMTVTVEGTPQVLKARHKMTLESVDANLAVLKNETQILSPVRDPAVEAQIVQAEQSGTLKFDLRTGRIIDQTSTLDKEVFGFQGPESKLRYQAEFSESLADEATAGQNRPTTEEDKTAAKPAATTNK